MAKKRMIDPQIWTDDKVVSLSPLARLLFIGMWNFACDNGHLDDSALQLKMRVLPADNCDAAELVDEILATGMAVRKDGFLKVVNLPDKQPLDLRFLVFCGHCREDPERRYQDADKKVSRGAHAGGARVTRERSLGAPRSGDGDGDGDGDGERGASRTPAASRGTRIPDDFTVTDEMRSWAKSKGFDHLDLEAITEEFFDYWHAVPGAKGVKLDWTGTWRNWIRRKAEDAKVRPIKPTQDPYRGFKTIDQIKAERGF